LRQETGFKAAWLKYDFRAVCLLPFLFSKT
jgi:hypothetical protein